MPVVSIGMPAFNNAPYIADAIESVLAQTMPDWELLIVDDGSSDKTGEVADRYAAHDSRIRVIHQPNTGISAARNQALEHAHRSTGFFAFLDSDDVWYPRALETLLDALQHQTGAVGAHGMRIYMAASGDPALVDGVAGAPLRRRAIDRGRLCVLPDVAPTTFETLAYGNCVFTGALLARCDAVRRAGAFDAGAVVAEDWDMWLRLALQGPLVFVKEPIYRYRMHATNISRDATQKNAALYYVRNKLATNRRLSRKQRAAVIAGFRWYEIYRATACFRGMWRANARTSALRERSAAAVNGCRHLASALAGRRGLARLAQQYIAAH